MNDVAAEVPIRVINKHRASAEERRQAIYIGRGSPLGNPFKTKPHGSHERGTTLSLYEEHLRGEIEEKTPDVCAALNQIWKRVREAKHTGEEVLLMCFCKPKPCHGDVVKAIVAEQLQAASEENVKNAAGNRHAPAGDERDGYYLMGGYAARGRGSAEGPAKDRAMRRVADGAIVELADQKRPSSTRTTIRVLGAPSFQNEGEVVMLARNGSLRGESLRGKTRRRIERAHQSGARFVVGDMPGVDEPMIRLLDRIGALYCIFHAGQAPRIDVTSLHKAAPSGGR